MAKTILSDLFGIFRVSVNAVLPENLTRKSVKYDIQNQQLNILGENYNLQNKNVHIIGTGKAVQYTAKALETILRSKIKSGIVSIPVGTLDNQKTNGTIQYYEGAKNNLPDVAAETTAKKVKDLVQSLSENDLIIVLISGGGSALLPLPKEPITLEEKTDLIKKLANSGADIRELNSVRKRLSDLKGGELVLKSKPATVVSLILSDIVGDPLDLIASGPTVLNEDDPAKAINIIKKYNLYDNIPHRIRLVLNNSLRKQEFPKDVKNYIIGSNKICISAAAAKCLNLSYVPITLSNMVTGNVKTIAEVYANLVLLFCKFLNMELDIELLKSEILNLNVPGIDAESIKVLIDNIFIDFNKISNKGLCLILGGEITVEVKGTGIGGRNQQLALEFSKFMHLMKDNFVNFDVYILCAGTDGIDGPTDAAGAVGYVNLIEDSEKENLNVNTFIENCDSYNFYRLFKNGEYHFICGHTNTNVMDLHLIIIKKK